jgi:hypothetical protein
MNQNPFVQEDDHEGTIGAVRSALQLLMKQLQDGRWAEYCIAEGCDNALAHLEQTLIHERMRCTCQEETK